MASSKEFAQFVCDQVEGLGDVTMRRMFGEYFIYVDSRPILLICNNTVYVRTYPEIAHLMKGSSQEPPFDGAKPWWVLDIEDRDLVEEVVEISLPLTPVPVRKKRKIQPKHTGSLGSYRHVRRRDVE